MTRHEPNAIILSNALFNLAHVPELIGQTQYRKLLTALGVAEHETPTGEEFAQLVQGMAAGQERKKPDPSHAVLRVIEGWGGR